MEKTNNNVTTGTLVNVFMVGFVLHAIHYANTKNAIDIGNLCAKGLKKGIKMINDSGKKKEIHVHESLTE